MNWANTLIHTVAIGLYPAWQGANHASFEKMAIYTAFLAIGVYATGPKASEVAGNPSKRTIFLFSAILATVGASLAYMIGYTIFG